MNDQFHDWKQLAEIAERRAHEAEAGLAAVRRENADLRDGALLEAIRAQHRAQLAEVQAQRDDWEAKARGLDQSILLYNLDRETAAGVCAALDRHFHDHKMSAVDLVEKVLIDLAAVTARANEVPGLSATLDEAQWEAAAMRISLLETAFDVSAERSLCKLCRTETPRGAASWRQQRESHQHAPTCSLASDAGRALLERLERAERERDEAQGAWDAAREEATALGLSLTEVSAENARLREALEAIREEAGNTAQRWIENQASKALKPDAAKERPRLADLILDDPPDPEVPGACSICGLVGAHKMSCRPQYRRGTRDE